MAGAVLPLRLDVTAARADLERLARRALAKAGAMSEAEIRFGVEKAIDRLRFLRGNRRGGRDSTKGR